MDPCSETVRTYATLQAFTLQFNWDLVMLHITAGHTLLLRAGGDGSEQQLARGPEIGLEGFDSEVRQNTAGVIRPIPSNVLETMLVLK